MTASVTVAADGRFTYTPAGNFFGTDTFTYTVSDGNGGADTATVTVTVTPVNDTPVANEDAFAGAEDVPITGGVLANDADPDNLAPPANAGLTVTTASPITTARGGTVTIAPNGNFTYTPPADFNGTDTFTYTVSDGTTTDTAAVTLTVAPVDDAPTAANDAATVAEDAGATAIHVLGNDSFAPDAGETLAIAAVTQGANGTVAITGGGTGLTYTPAPNFFGTDTFTYTISDGTATATAAVTVAVTPVNDPPTFAVGPSVSAAGSGPRTTAGFATGITAGPPDESGQALTFLLFTDNSGLFAAQPAIDPATGALKFTPVVRASGIATITAVLRDNGGAANGGVDTSAVRTFTVVVARAAGDQVPVGSSATAVGPGPGSSPLVRAFHADGSQRATRTVFAPAFSGGVRVASADFNADGVPDIVAGTGPGGPTRVRVLDGKSDVELFAVDPFEASFTGGVYVAAGDITGDGAADLVITPDEGGGPRARVFSGNGFTQVADFFGINDPNFRGGARASIGALDGDRVGDLIVAAGFGGGPRVAAFDGRKVAAEGGRPGDQQTAARWESWKLFGDFLAFEEGLRNGVFVAAGDFDGDGFAELAAGGPGGGPRVSTFDGQALTSGGGAVRDADFFAGDVNDRGGVRLAAKDLDRDERADLVAGAGAGSRVTAYAGTQLVGDKPPELFALDAFPGFTGGVFVG